MQRKLEDHTENSDHYFTGTCMSRIYMNNSYF